MKRSENLILLYLILSVVIKLYAQQDAQYTNYMYNMSLINPAYAGTKDVMSLGITGRSQWVGVKGAPQTISAFINSPIAKSMGLGVSLLHDKAGPVKETHLYADYSYSLKLSGNSKLALGIKAGATFQQIGTLELNQVDENDPQFAQDVNKAHPNFGLGVFYYRPKFYFGFSMPNVLETLHFQREGGTITKASEEMHTFVTSGIIFDLNEHFKIKPSFLTKYAKNAPLSLDISVNVLWNDKFEFGISHRIEDSFSALLNFRVNRSLRFGYSYDHTLSNIGDFNSGSHELILLFDFKKEAGEDKELTKGDRFY